MTDVDDIQSFIAAQKRRIEQERSGLSEPNIGHQNVMPVSYKDRKTQQDNITNVIRQEQPKAPKETKSSPSVLELGSYENVQEKLRKERAEEYKKFLAEKSYRTIGKKSPRDIPVEKPSMKSALKQDYASPRANQGKSNSSLMNGDAYGSQRRPLDDAPEPQNRWRAAARPQKTLDELYDAYEELLERKRQDERRYRSGMDDPYLDSRHVRFNDETPRKTPREPWLENGTRRKWDHPDQVSDGLAGGRRYTNTEFQDSRTLEDFQERSRGRRQVVPDDRMSRSAPPTAAPAKQAVPIFGEHDMSPEVKQQRQTKYREELQAQMKEREMQKKREKNHMFVDDSRKQDLGLNSLPNGEASPRRHQPSFPRNDHPRADQPFQAPPDLASRRYEPTLQQTNNRPNQMAYDQPYNYSHLNQPLNYPSSLLSTGPLLSSLNPSSGLLGGYSSSLREPVGMYQPSWVADNAGLGQRTTGLVTSLGETGGMGDPGMRSRLNQSNGHLEKGLSNTGFGSFGSTLSQSDGAKEKDRSRQQSYREELTRQMMEKEERKKKDKAEVERYNMKLERELEEYNPWGKAGGGAPLKDQTGRLVSDLRQMHQYNKEGTIISPRDRGKSLEPSLVKETFNTSSEIKTEAVSPATKVDQFQPSSMQMENNDVQKNAQQEYKDYLRQQVEEKQRKKKEEEERLREAEERQDKIIQEQQRKLKEEYEKELEAAKQKEEAARLKNEEMRKAAEEKKKETERRRLEEDRKQEEKLHKQLEERLKAAKANTNRSGSPPLPSAQNAVRSSSPPIPTLQKQSEVQRSPPSPPIPTLQNRQRSDSPPIPTLQNGTAEKPGEFSSNLQRQSSFNKQSSRPPSSSRRDHRRPETPPSAHQTLKQDDRQGRRSRPSSATADIDVLSQLTSLRRQLKKEEVKVQQQLSENKEKYVKLRENSGTRRNKKAADVFDNVFRRQPNIAQKYQDAQTTGAINEFNKLKYEDNSSLHGDFLNQYPEPATSPSTLDLQQKSLLQEQQKRLESFKDKENRKSFENHARPPSNTSQLESESQFVPVDDPSQVPQGETSKPFLRKSSARERRRWKDLENLAKASKLSDYKPPTPGGSSLNSVTSFNVDEIAQKNEERLRRLEAMKQSRAESKGDPNEVLKRFIKQHSRPDSKSSENSLPADKRYLPNM
ncbi:centrosome and spindle pole-associated protein 1-like isoform X2 [Dendronephthya gigantea]|uniref:centrosome and spindle pole-associated protein 1-like isoform X2 n=1 Tax=Dendronephthya gigantea TaxID=151771 RepID=UPI001069951E|nr:centrosome and spindle pole-associated protein 1-like isoform X2 [Dendronephthya gigantea]